MGPPSAPERDHPPGSTSAGSAAVTRRHRIGESESGVGVPGGACVRGSRGSAVVGAGQRPALYRGAGRGGSEDCLPLRGGRDKLGLSREGGEGQLSDGLMARSSRRCSPSLRRPRRAVAGAGVEPRAGQGLAGGGLDGGEGHRAVVASGGGGPETNRAALRRIQPPAKQTSLEPHLTGRTRPGRRPSQSESPRKTTAAESRAIPVEPNAQGSQTLRLPTWI